MKTSEKPPTAAAGWKAVGVNLPPTIVAIIQAAGGDDLTGKRGMPYALASIMGALPWIAVALYKTLPPDEYAAFARSVKGNMQQVWAIIGADDPPAAFDEAYAKAKRSLQ